MRMVLGNSSPGLEPLLHTEIAVCPHELVKKGACGIYHGCRLLAVTTGMFPDEVQSAGHFRPSCFRLMCTL